jgi:hypothetical protein
MARSDQRRQIVTACVKDSSDSCAHDYANMNEDVTKSPTSYMNDNVSVVTTCVKAVSRSEDHLSTL